MKHGGKMCRIGVEALTGHAFCGSTSIAWSELPPVIRDRQKGLREKARVASGLPLSQAAKASQVLAW
jgi:hypothetical protein